MGANEGEGVKADALPLPEPFELDGIRFELAWEGRTRCLVGPDASRAEKFLEEHEPYHEAAHAVACLALGVEVDYSTLVNAEIEEMIMGGPNPVSGATKHADPQDAYKTAVIAIVGPVFDLSQGFPWLFACLSSPPDVMEWERFAPTESEQRRAFRHAKRILLERQHEVRLIGRLLAEKRRLTGQEIVEAL